MSYIDSETLYNYENDRDNDDEQCYYDTVVAPSLAKIKAYKEKKSSEINNYCSSGCLHGSGEDMLYEAQETFMDWCEDAETIAGDYLEQTSDNPTDALEMFEGELDGVLWDKELICKVRTLLLELKVA